MSSFKQRCLANMPCSGKSIMTVAVILVFVAVITVPMFLYYNRKTEKATLSSTSTQQISSTMFIRTSATSLTVPTTTRISGISTSLTTVLTTTAATTRSSTTISSTRVIQFTEMYSAIPEPTTNYSYLNAISMGHLNDDSIIDMAAVYRNTHRVVVWFGFGNGTFTLGAPYATDFNPYDLSIIDLTGDGRPDVLVLCFGSATINLFVNQGGGVFASKQTVGSTGSFSYPLQMVLADMDGNGLIDVIVADWYSPFVSVLLNRGYTNGTQFALVTNTSYPFDGNSIHPVSVVASDFNRDSFLDIIAITNNGTIVVLLGQGNGRLALLQVYSTGGETGWVSSGVAFDANRDGNMDLAVTNSNSDSVSVFFGDGQGHLSIPTLYSTTNGPSVMRVIDANHDNSSDLLFLDGSNCYTLFTGTTNGSFATVIPCGTISTGYATGLGVADINNDNILDMAIGCTGTINILIFLGSFK